MAAAFPWLGVTQPTTHALTHPNNTGPTARRFFVSSEKKVAASISIWDLV